MTKIPSKNFGQLELTKAFKKDYLTELIEIREFLESKIERFPLLRCHESTYFLSKTLQFEEKGGTYIDPVTFIQRNHYLNYSKLFNVYVCLSMDQFNTEKTRYPKVSIFEGNVPFYIERPRYTQYQKRRLWNNDTRLKAIKKITDEYLEARR